MPHFIRRSAFLLPAILIVEACSTYYRANLAFNEEFERGDMRKALKTLRAKPSEGAGKKQFLYFSNNGLICSLLGEYQESNEYFEKAYLFGEDYRINYLNEVASYLTNPNFTIYRGEDHEHLMLLYYKAINYLKLGKREEALVECRRLNIRLQQLTDRYESNDKYRKDAFVHTLMGIIYDADKDYNNAFIAYRNAIEVYDTDFRTLFGVIAPTQLKLDLLRTAKLSGMDDEFERFKEKFNMPDYQVEPSQGGELVFFWHNGLSPVKAEWGVSFVIQRNGDEVTFTSRETGMSFPFNAGNYDERDRNALERMRVFRVVFPRYIERPVYFNSASVSGNGKEYPLELMEDVSKVAFKCLEERMTLEFSKALLRLAVKKAAEQSLRKEDKRLGALMGIINAMTEKADTRNWQTLPHSIYYTRIPLHEGSNTLVFSAKDFTGKGQEHSFTYEVRSGETHFHTFTSLESSSPAYGYY